MEIIIDVIKEIWNKLRDAKLSEWGTWASIVSLIGVIYNYAKLSQIYKIVEQEHDKVLEAMKPFELYDAVRKLRKSLETERYTRKKIAILKSLDDFSENLRSYFRQIHGLSGTTDNMYLEMGHCLLQKNRTEEALEHFRKALAVAKEKDDKDEEIECLAGLRECHALEVHVDDFIRTDEEFEKQYPAIHLTFWQRIVVARKITLVWVRVFAEVTFAKRKRKVHRRYPGIINGSTRKDIAGEAKLAGQHLSETPQPPGNFHDQLP